jgi:hypothetical protein
MKRVEDGRGATLTERRRWRRCFLVISVRQHTSDGWLWIGSKGGGRWRSREVIEEERRCEGKVAEGGAGGLSRGWGSVTEKAVGGGSGPVRGFPWVALTHGEEFEV